MPIIADSNCFTAKADQSFDVKFIRRNVPVRWIFPSVGGNALGFKHNNLAAFRFSKIVSQSVHEQMISSVNFHFYYVIAFVKKLSLFKISADFQMRAHFQW